jgi:hypothetical protein
VQFSDDKIAVLNNGPVDPELWYGGKPRRFVVGKAIVIPAIEAYHHFGVEVQGGKIVRNKADMNPDGTQTQYASRVASLSPYGLIHGPEKHRNEAKFKEFRDWFENGLQFKVVKSVKEIDSQEFSHLK